MTPRLRGAEYLREYKILVTFEDGKTGVIDMEHELWGEVFEPLRDVGLFRRFQFDAELDTIVWPTGADLAPEYLYEKAAATEISDGAASTVDQPFFPVSKVRVHASNTGHAFKRSWAVVSGDRREIFSIVTKDYRLVSNKRAYELGRRAFALVFGPDAAAGLRLFHVNMPATRSWAHIDLTADDLEFTPLDEDRWLPFLRVTNSYNRNRALGFVVGVCRSICTNGMIFGEHSLKLKVAHTADVDPERRIAEVFSRRRFDAAGYKDKIEKLTRLSVPAEKFLAGILEILEVNVPTEPPRKVARRDAWSRLGPWLRGLGEKYRKELGATAYALVNAACEYASDRRAPLMSPARVNTMQFRCGNWVDRIVDRRNLSLAPGSIVDIKQESMDAAKRLTAIDGLEESTMSKERTSLNTSGKNWKVLEDKKGNFGVSDLFDTVLLDVDGQIARLKDRVYRSGVWYSMPDGRCLVPHLGVDVLTQHRGCVGLLVFEHALDLIGREIVDGLRNRFEWMSGFGYYTKRRIHTIFRFRSKDDWEARREDILRLVSVIDRNAAVRPD